MTRAEIKKVERYATKLFGVNCEVTGTYTTGVKDETEFLNYECEISDADANCYVGRVNFHRFTPDKRRSFVSEYYRG